MSEAIHRFTVILSGLTEMTDAAANALYEAGCDDGSPGSCEGVAFDREASSLSEAIHSAVRDVRKAGFDVVRVEIEAEDLEEWPDASSPANA